jgi:hypothetical protein
LTVKVTDLVTPAPETEIVVVVVVEVKGVMMLKPPVVDPAGMVTAFGIVAADGLLFVSGRVRSEESGEAIVTVPKDPLLAWDTGFGLTVSDAGGACGVSVSCVCTVLVFKVALSVTVVLLVTALVGTSMVTD